MVIFFFYRISVVFYTKGTLLIQFLLNFFIVVQVSIFFYLINKGGALAVI